MMKLKNKQYKLRDYVLMPYQAAPLLTLSCIATKFVSAGCSGLLAYATGWLLDSLIGLITTGSGWSPVPFAGVLAVLLLAWLSGSLETLLMGRLSLRLGRELALAFAAKTARLKYACMEDKETRELIGRVGTDPAGHWMAGFHNLLKLLEYIVRAGSLLLIIAMRQWGTSLLVALLIIPFFYISIQNGKEEYEAYEGSSRHFRRAAYFRQLLSGRAYAEERELFGYTDFINGKWSEQYQKAIAIEKQANKKVFFRVSVAGVFAAFLTCCIAFVLAFPVFSYHMTAGFYIAVVKGTMNFTDMISWQFAQVMVDYEKSKLYLKDVTSFVGLGEDTKLGGEDPADVLDEPIRTVEFQDVSFSYPGTDHVILDHISFRLDGRKQYAFVGENGAGKTTVTKLLTGLYDTYTGNILINGKNIRMMEPGRLRAYFSVVYQDFARYEISVRDNLLCPFRGCPSEGILREGSSQQGILREEDAAERRLWEILCDLGMEDFIAALPQGLDTNLGRLEEGSEDLSGGQWQRLAIARSLASNAPIHILDEPTAALDPVNEAGIYSIFQKIMKRKFTIFITHRLGAARMADEILVLHGGKVAERGSHEELLKSNGIYADMFGVQRSWYHG